MRTTIAELLLPPTGFVLLAIAGLCLQGRWARTGRRLTWTALIALILMGMPIVSDTALLALETDQPTAPPADHPPQAIVVLSAELIRSQHEKLGFRPGLLTLDRLRAAAALQRRTGLPVLVSGGTNDPDVAALGQVMAQSLEDDFRTPARWVETKSRDTWENARFSGDILRPLGITSVYVVTHSWHMRRAVLAFQQAGFIVTAAPTALDNPMDPDLTDFLPRAGAWQSGYYALHEWIGYAWYAFR